MCLDTEGTFKPCKVGYKIMTRKDGLLFGEWRNKSRPREEGVWLNERDFRDASSPFTSVLRTFSSNSPYPIGWHIYHSTDSARYWSGFSEAVVKVAVGSPVAVGYQGMGRHKVTVAKEIKILEVS